MRNFDWSEILREELGELRAYSPSPGSYKLRLDANEAPPLMSAEMRKALQEETSRVLYEKYPDASQTALRKAIAKHHGVKSNQVIVGVGSDEIISLLLTAATRLKSKAPAPTLVTTTPTFVMYRLSARVRGQRVMEVPLDKEWDIDWEKMRRAIEIAAPNVVFIASPNNPTGTMASADRLASLIEASPQCLFVIDEAYVDYASRDQSALLSKYENVALLRTLSKVGFAALRVGWLVGSEALVSELHKVRLPYNLPTLSQVLATVVLEQFAAELEATRNYVRGERARLGEALNQLSGVTVAAGQEANFLWVELRRPSVDVFSDLAKAGVLVRSFHGRGGRLERFLRITVGTTEQNDELLAALSACA